MRTAPALGVALALLTAADSLAAPGLAVRVPAVFTRWARRAADRPIRLELVLELAGTRHPVGLDEAGFRAAERVLAWAFPGEDAAGVPAWTTSGAFAVMEELSDPAFEAEFVRIADLSRRAVFRVLVVLDDDPERPVTAAVHTRDGVREIRFGENRIQRDGALESFLPVLLHEVGHVADDTGCRLDYGPDGAHYSYEILNPGAAFKEGWGDYLGAKLPGAMRGFVEAPRPLAIEGSVGGQGRAGVYLTLEPGDRTLNDLLSNEAWVARILLDLEGLAPGRAGVERVFVATNRDDCRHLAGFLAAWLATYPDTREAVSSLLATRFGEVSDDADRAAVMAGRLLDGLEADELPRPRDYRPGVQAGPGWLARVLAAARERLGLGDEPAPAPAEPVGGLLGTSD